MTPLASSTTMNNAESKNSKESTLFWVETPRGQTVCTSVVVGGCSLSYDALLERLWDAALSRDVGSNHKRELDNDHDSDHSRRVRRRTTMLVHDGKVVDDASYGRLLHNRECFVSLRLRLLGGIDRQNRVGSKFGGGGVSSSQHAERERKERLRQLALESIDLAKDPYLMKNHLGTYECKLCLTLHTNEANYLAHTQGKKHQAGLARRAHLEKLKQEQQEGTMPLPQLSRAKQAVRKVRIGRPAYQVFKSRDPETDQRCLSFELQYPEIEADIQPRRRFMSAFEQRVDSPPDRRYQYLLIAADPYETVAFKIPNEPIDKGEGRFVTHWDTQDKKFMLTLYFVDDAKQPAK